MTSGTATEREATIELLIAEVELTDQGVMPVFKIPTETRRLLDASSHNEEDGPPVRTVVRLVGRPRRRANRVSWSPVTRCRCVWPGHGPGVAVPNELGQGCGG